MSLLGPACGWVGGGTLSATRIASNLLLFERFQSSLAASAFRFVPAMLGTASDSLESSGNAAAGVDGGLVATSVHPDQELGVSVGVVLIIAVASGNWDQDRVFT